MASPGVRETALVCFVLHSRGVISPAGPKVAPKIMQLQVDLFPGPQKTTKSYIEHFAPSVINLHSIFSGKNTARFDSVGAWRGEFLDSEKHAGSDALIETIGASASFGPGKNITLWCAWGRV